jgi:hypothetical protein
MNDHKIMILSDQGEETHPSPHYIRTLPLFNNLLSPVLQLHWQILNHSVYKVIQDNGLILRCDTFPTDGTSGLLSLPLYDTILAESMGAVQCCGLWKWIWIIGKRWALDQMSDKKKIKLRGLSSRANYTDRPVVSAADELRLYSRISRQEPLLFLPSSSSVVLTRLSGPRCRLTTS